jgi:hypothetical protein
MGAPVAIGIATEVVDGIRIIVTDGILVTPASSSETAEDAALGRAEFWAKDDNANEACGKIVAWVEAAKIEDTKEIASLGTPLFEATSDDRRDPISPLGTCTAAVGVEIPGRFPTLVTPPSSADTAEDASLGKTEFCAKDDKTDEACGRMVACVGAASIEETRDKAALGNAVFVFEATRDERTLPNAPLGTDKTAVALAPLLPIISVGMRPASTVSRPVTATPRHRTSVQVVRAPFVPVIMTGATKVVSLAAAAPCAKDKVARSLDPRTDVGNRPTLIPSRLVAATFKQRTSAHVVVARPSEAVIVIGWARLVAVGEPAKLAPRASEPMLLLPSSEVGSAPALLSLNREVAAVCRQNTSEHVVVRDPSVAVMITGSARPVWEGNISVPRSFPSTEVGISPALMPNKEDAASWTHIMSVHTVVVLPSVATTVTCSESWVAVGATVVSPRERVPKLFPPRTEVGIRLTGTDSRLDAAAERQTISVHVEVGLPLLPEMVTGVANIVATWVGEALGINPRLALTNPVTATLRQARSVQVVWAPFVDTTTGRDSVLDAWLLPRPRDRLTRPPLDEGKAPTPSPSPPICALKQRISVHVVVADVVAAELVDAAIAKEDMMEFTWPERVAVPDVASDAIEDNIDCTLLGIAAALLRTLARDTKDDWGWLAMTLTCEAREATAAGSVRIEDAVSRDEIAAVLELAPVTPLRASDMWNPRLVGNAVAADKTEFSDETAWVLLVATGFARMLESRDAMLVVWPSTTDAIEGIPVGETLTDKPADTLTELRTRVGEDEATLRDTLADTLAEPRGCVAEERMAGITAEDTRLAELAMDNILLAELAMGKTLLAELATGNATLDDARLVAAVVDDAPAPPRPMDRRAELWATPIPRAPRSVVPELPPIRARFSWCSWSWSSVGELYRPAGAAIAVAAKAVKEVTVTNRMVRNGEQ